MIVCKTMKYKKIKVNVKKYTIIVKKSFNQSIDVKYAKLSKNKYLGIRVYQKISCYRQNVSNCKSFILRLTAYNIRHTI